MPGQPAGFPGPGSCALDLTHECGRASERAGHTAIAPEIERVPGPPSCRRSAFELVPKFEFAALRRPQIHLPT